MLMLPPQDTPQVDSRNNCNSQSAETEKKIVDFCITARNVQEILEQLKLRDRKNLMVYIKRLLEQGRIARTIPDKTNSKNQKYISIKDYDK